VRLSDKVAIVTGASRGLGRAISLALAEEGADLVLADKDPTIETARLVSEIGRKALSVKLDIRNAADVDNMVSRTVKEYGKINVLVNNAGVFIAANVVDMTEQEWDLVLDVNAKGCFLCCRAVAREMIRHNIPGKIVNISSNAGLVGYDGYSAYCVSKFGIIGLTQSLAKELAPHNIHVNAICPGDIETDMLVDEIRKVAKTKSASEEEVKKEKMQSIPIGRFAKPREVAQLVVFLASEESNYVTGAFVKITGGK
jgi:NAD(P)-dependent dehydrogenase (short-subunit alcohol dehydrogenase family)